jgi:hypothetical protein
MIQLTEHCLVLKQATTKSNFTLTPKAISDILTPSAISEVEEKYAPLIKILNMTSIYNLFGATHIKLKPCDNSVMELIKNLKNLKSIDLSNCGLTELPDFILCMPKLEHIDLSNNDLIQIPPNFCKFHTNPYLMSVNLSNNNIYEIPKIFRKRALWRVDLTNNPADPNKLVRKLKYTKKFNVSYSESGGRGCTANIYLYDGEPETNLIRKIESWVKQNHRNYTNVKYKYTQIKI